MFDFRNACRVCGRVLLSGVVCCAEHLHALASHHEGHEVPTTGVRHEHTQGHEHAPEREPTEGQTVPNTLAERTDRPTASAPRPQRPLVFRPEDPPPDLLAGRTIAARPH